MNPLSLLAGAPAPAFWSLPATAVGSAGLEAAQLAADLGLPLEPSQRFLVELLLAERDDHRFAAFEAAVVQPRQLGKTLALQVCAVHDLFLRGVGRVVWTAHLRKTTLDTFGQLEAWVTGTDWLRRQVSKVSRASGEESIVLRGGGRIDFLARTAGGGRGLAGDVVVLDEALELTPQMLGALIPTLTTRPNAQVRYGSSAGILKSEVLRAVRDRGRAGGDPSLAYAEWTAGSARCGLERCGHFLGSPDCALDDERLWQQANPLGPRVTLEYLRNERRALPPAQFAVERMGWWEDPPAGGAGVLPSWPFLYADVEPVRPVFGVDLGEDRLVSIGAAWRHRDKVAVALTQDTADAVDTGLQPATAVRRLVGLHERWRATVMLGGPSAAMEDELRAQGVRCQVVTAAQFAAACGQIADRAADRTLTHGNQPALNLAVQSSRWRPVGTSGERAWQLKDAPGVGPLAAVTRAVAGLNVDRPRIQPTAFTGEPSEMAAVAAMEF